MSDIAAQSAGSAVVKPKLAKFVKIGSEYKDQKTHFHDFSLSGANSNVNKHDEPSSNNMSKDVVSLNKQTSISVVNSEEKTVSSRQHFGARSQNAFELSSVYKSPVKEETQLERQLNKVKINLFLAEAYVANILKEYKISMPPEKRRKELVQTEISKLILFVARQFNVREELELLTGCPLDELDFFSYRSLSLSNEELFFSKEAPPDLSLPELKQATCEMERRLKAELAKRRDKAMEPRISADRVSSNLSEILWLIESLDFDLPARDDTELESENKDDQSIAPAILTTSSGSNLTRSITKELAQVQLRLQQQKEKNQADVNEKSEDLRLSPQETTTTTNDVGFSQRDLITTSGPSPQKESFFQGLKPRERSSLGNETGDELLGFSIDHDSPVIGLAEAKDLNLLQFMYDAIKAGRPDMEMEQITEKESDSVRQARLSAFNGSGDAARSSTKRSDLSHAPGMTALTTTDTECRFLSAFGRTISSPGAESNEEVEEVNAENVFATTGQPSLSFTIPSLNQEPVQGSLWTRAPQPPVQIYPLRRNLLDILRELYTNFNYNYYFQQFKPKQKEYAYKSEREYSEEMERRVSKHMSERRERERLAQVEASTFCLEMANNVQSEQLSLSRRRSMRIRKSISAANKSEKASSSLSEMPQNEEVLVNEAEPAVKEEKLYDEAILISEEVGDGFMFVLKGRKERGLLSASSGDHRRQSVVEGKSLGKKRRSTNKAAFNASLRKKKNNKTDSPSSVTKPEYESYVLYALNQSNTPQRAFVHIDASKLQNLKLNFMTGYKGKKDRIAVELPPQGSTSLLVLRPIKKKQQVMFDGALLFSETLAAEESEDKSSATEKTHLRRKTESLSMMFGQSSLKSTNTARVSSGSTAKQNLLNETRKLEDTTEHQLANDQVDDETCGVCDAKDVFETEENVDILQTTNTDVGLSPTHMKSSQGSKSDNEEETSFFLDSNIGRKFNRRRKQPDFRMFKRSSTDEGSFVVDEQANTEGSSVLSGPSNLLNIPGGWSVTILNVDGESKEQNEFARRKSTARSRQKGFEELLDKGEKKAAENLGDFMLTKGKETTAADNSPAEEDLDLVRLTAEEQSGPPFEQDHEAFEKNCVVLSVLQSSEWRSDLTSQGKLLSAEDILSGDKEHDNDTTNNAAERKKENRKKKDGMKKATKAGEVALSKDLKTSSSLPTTVSRRATRKLGEEQKAEEIVSSLLDRFYGDGADDDDDAVALETEEIVANTLRRIAEEERLGEKIISQDGCETSLTQQESGVASAGSAKLSWHNLPSKEQYSQFAFGHDEEKPQTFLSEDGKDFEDSVLPQSTTRIGKTQGLVHSAAAALRRDSASCSKGALGARASFQLDATGQLSRLHGSEGAFKMELPYSDGEMKEVLADETLSDDYYHAFPSKMGEANAYGFFCEACASGVHDEHHFHETEDNVEATGGVIADKTSRIEQKEEVPSEAITSTIFATEGLRDGTASPMLPTAQRSQANLESLLAGVKKASGTETPTSSLLPLKSKRQKRTSFVLPFVPELISPTQQNAYTEQRPGGRLVVLAPEEAGSRDQMVSGKVENQNKARGSISATATYFQTVTKGFRSSLHACARNSTANNNNHFFGTRSDSVSFGRAAARKKKISDMRSALDSLPAIVFAGEQVQEVEDIEAAESEARELFLLDPARYDCVLDDLVKLATERVQKEEEEHGATAVLAKRGTLAPADESVLQRNKLHLPALSKRSSIPSLHASRFSDSNFVGSSSFGVFNGKVENSSNNNMSSALAEKTQVAITSELQRLLDEQRRAKRVVAFILMEMRRMWQRREMEANLALRAAVERFIYRSLLFSWHFERRRVLNLRKLIYLLDRKTLRVGGWMPFYAKDSVVEERFVWEPAPPHLSRPLRVVHRAMCLARRQRLLPLRLVRLQALRKPSPTPHILYGYKRTLLEPFTTTAMRLREERRARCARRACRAAPLQSSSAKFSPQPLQIDGKAMNQA